MQTTPKTQIAKTGKYTQNVRMKQAQKDKLRRGRATHHRRGHGHTTQQPENVNPHGKHTTRHPSLPFTSPQKTPTPTCFEQHQRAVTTLGYVCPRVEMLAPTGTERRAIANDGDDTSDRRQMPLTAGHRARWKYQRGCHGPIQDQNPSTRHPMSSGKVIALSGERCQRRKNLGE